MTVADAGGRDGAARDTDRRSSRALLAAIVRSLALTGTHGFAHGRIPVPLATWQQGYAAVVLVGLPLAGGLGALGFELLAHFIVANPDHVASVDAGRALFAGTAGLSVIGDAVLAAAAASALWGQSQGSSATSPSDSTT